MILCNEKVLSEPLLYLSLYFKRHRLQYYEILNRVRFDGEWEAWLEFFAEAVEHTAMQSVETIKQLLAVSERDIQKIKSQRRSPGSILIVHRELMRRPLIDAPTIAKSTKLSNATVYNSLLYLQKLGMVKEMTGQKRNRLYYYKDYLEIMRKGI